MEIGTKMLNKMFGDVVNIIQEVLTAFGGDILYGRTIGAPQGQAPAAAPQGTEEQRHMLIGWFSAIFSGLSLKDESAFLEALQRLTPAEWSIMGRRLKALGDPNKDDTPEARAFRKAVVLIEDFEMRVAVLQKAVRLDDESWLMIANASGAAVAGQVDRAYRLIRDKFFPKVMEKLQAADVRAAGAIQSLEIHPHEIEDGMKQWRLKRQEKLNRREAARGFWRRLGEWFGILRPLPLDFGTASRGWRGFLESFGFASSRHPSAGSHGSMGRGSGSHGSIMPGASMAASVQTSGGQSIPDENWDEQD